MTADALSVLTADSMTGLSAEIASNILDRSLDVMKDITKDVRSFGAKEIEQVMKPSFETISNLILVELGIKQGRYQ